MSLRYLPACKYSKKEKNSVEINDYNHFKEFINSLTL